jgi:hypothetical protein
MVDDRQPDLFGRDPERRRAAQEAKAECRRQAENRRAEQRRGARLATEGMVRVAGATEAKLPGWSDQAFGHLRRVATVRLTFTGEDIKRAAYEAGLPVPPNESAWGSVMRRGSREKVMVQDGVAAPVSASRHGAPNRRWRSNIFGRGLT